MSVLQTQGFECEDDGEENFDSLYRHKDVVDKAHGTYVLLDQYWTLYVGKLTGPVIAPILHFLKV